MSDKYERMPVDIAQTVFAMLPSELAAKCVIAGGAARDYWHAKDIDLWYLAKDEEEATAVSAKLTSMFVGTAVVNFAQYPGMKFVKCCEIPFHPAPKGPQVIQIMVAVGPDPVDLLEGFDISVHQFCVMPSGRLLYGPWCTEPGDYPIRVNRFDTPYSTLRRYFGVCQRYSTNPQWGDVTRLCRAVVNEADGKGSDATPIGDISNEEPF